MFVLRIDSSKGHEFVARKTAANFTYLQNEVVNHTPLWRCASCPPPDGVKRVQSFLSMFSSGSKVEGEDAVEVWKRCRTFVEQFVQDYVEHKDDPILSKPGCLGDSVGLNLRVSFRCLFFLQRDVVLDKLSNVPAMYRKGRCRGITEQKVHIYT